MHLKHALVPWSSFEYDFELFQGVADTLEASAFSLWKFSISLIIPQTYSPALGALKGY
jgi:hypothetical protein